MDEDALPNILRMVKSGELIAVYVTFSPETILFIPAELNPKKGPFLSLEEVEYMFDLAKVRDAAKWN